MWNVYYWLYIMVIYEKTCIANEPTLAHSSFDYYFILSGIDITDVIDLTWRRVAQGTTGFYIAAVLLHT